MRGKWEAVRLVRVERNMVGEDCVGGVADLKSIYWPNIYTVE